MMCGFEAISRSHWIGCENNKETKLTIEPIALKQNKL